MEVNDNNIRDKVNELLTLQQQVKELNKDVRRLKGEILEYAQVENYDETSWAGKDVKGFVVIETRVSHELADLQPKVEINNEILSDEKFSKYVKTKLNLSRKGMKAFRNGDEDLQKLMIPKSKRAIKIILN